MDMAAHQANTSRLQGKKAVRSFARKLSEPDVIKDLNITPMMDMMTIILVFLLKTFTPFNPADPDTIIVQASGLRELQTTRPQDTRVAPGTRKPQKEGAHAGATLAVRCPRGSAPLPPPLGLSVRSERGRDSSRGRGCLA